MRTNLITALAVIVLILAGSFAHSTVTKSDPPDPATSKYASSCTDSVAEGAEISACCIDYNEAMDAAERDWQNNLQNMIGQETSASKMVDDAYENLRTYNCWLEYICRSVLYSGHAPIQSAYGTGLTSKHIGRVPGCQKPENITLEKEWGDFLNGMREVPIFGAFLTPVEDVVEDVSLLYTDNKFNFFPRCMTDENNNEYPQLSLAEANYQNCKTALEYRFGLKPEHSELEAIQATETSNAFVAVETVLKKTNADQKASALENKLSTIVPKLQQMETHVGYLSNFLQLLDQRFACYANKCT